MSEIRITIDGKEAVGQAGESILTIARNNGIDIPALCYEDGLSVYGACSLCVVEAENSPKLMRACATIPQDGMIIHTDSERAKRSRKVAMELLMSDHEGDCLGPCKLNCPAGTNCQAYVKQIALGNDKEAVRIIKEHLPLPASDGILSAFRRTNSMTPTQSTSESAIPSDPLDNTSASKPGDKI